jgi:dihydrofolate synthase/folylpolyglutamate synthase
LGETLEEIAFEKAGIIKEEVAVLVGPKALPFSIFEKEAFEKKAPFHRCEGVFSCYEEENQKIAERALSLLPFESDLKGLEARPPCRFERFSKEIPIVLDVAHNPGGFEALFARLKGQKIHLLLALGSEKEVLPILEVCKRNALFIHLTQSKNPKAASPYDLGNLLERLEFQDFAIVSSVKEAFHEAREHAFKCGAILCVAGTFYIMSEIRKELGLEEPQDPVLFSPY